MGALEYASAASWFINAPAPVGNKRLRAVESYDSGDEGSVTTQTEVGPSNAAVGFIDVPGGKTISFDIREVKGAKREVDWEYLQDNKIVFSLTKQIVGGTRKQYPECRISTIAPKGDNKGEHTYTVEIVALDRKSL